MMDQERRVQLKKIKLLVLMCLIALLTLATDGEPCCPNEEDGQRPPDIVLLDVLVSPQQMELRLGETASARVQVSCDLGTGTCPAVRAWDVQEGPGVIATGFPTVAFSVEAYDVWLTDLFSGNTLSRFDPATGRLSYLSYVIFTPILDPPDAAVTTVERGVLEVNIWELPSELPVTTIRDECGELYLGGGLSFGQVAVGQTEYRSLALLNQSFRPLTIIDVSVQEQPGAEGEFSPQEFEGLPTTVNPGQGKYLSLGLSPKSPGNKSAMVQVSYITECELSPKTTTAEAYGSGVEADAVETGLDSSYQLEKLEGK